MLLNIFTVGLVIVALAIIGFGLLHQGKISV
jgi:hypothetical protein